MASKLLNILKSIERGRQACINTMKEKNLIIQDNSSFDEIADSIRDIEVYNNAKSTIPHYYDNPEDDPIVYKIPIDWPDIETILKSQTEDLIKTDYYNVPIRIALLDNTQPTITFTMTTSNNVSATDDIIYVGKQDSSSDISYCNGVTVITSDGAEYNIGKYYGVDSIQHTWDSTKDIDNKYRWFVIKHIMHAYTGGIPPRQGYIHGMSANTTPLLAIIEAPGFCYNDVYYQMHGRYSKSLLFIKTISPFTPVHIAIANAVAEYRRNNTDQGTWKQIPLMANNNNKMLGVKRYECDVNINKDQYTLPDLNSDYVNLEVFICNAELSSINKNSIRMRYFNESNLIYFKTALSPKNAYGLSDLFDSLSNTGGNSSNTIRPYMPLRYLEISNLEQYIAEQSCLRCRGLAGLADLKPEHKQKLLDNLEITSGGYYGNYFDDSFIHDKQVNINLHTGNIPPSQSGTNTFYNCHIDHLIIHNLAIVEKSTFYGATIRSITLPDCVTFKATVQYGTFYVDLPNCTELSVTALVSNSSTIRIINMHKYRVTDPNFFIKNNMLEDVVVGSIYCDVNLSESIVLKPEGLAHIFDALETLSNAEAYTITIPSHLHNVITQADIQSAETKGWKVVY